MNKPKPVEIDSAARIVALAKHLQCEIADLREYGDMAFARSMPGGTYSRREEYRVMTDEEADQAWEESLDSYIDDCILIEIENETLSRYFDREAWKRDARHDGRGHSLSSYDGDEWEVKTDDGQRLYIYRNN